MVLTFQSVHQNMQCDDFLESLETKRSRDAVCFMKQCGSDFGVWIKE